MLYPHLWASETIVAKNGERFVASIKRELLQFMPLKKNKSCRTCRFFALFFFSFILGSNLLFSLDPKDELQEYFLRNWTVQSGLPLNTITALVQTQDGYIWAGTSAGLARFDGVRFKTFTRQNSPLSNDRITSLYEDADKVLWIGTDGGGLYSYEKGLWKNFTMKDGLSNAHVRTIIGDWKGGLWVGTDYGLNLMSQDSVHVYTEEDGLYDNIIIDLCRDNWGTLWIGTMRGGLARFNEGMIAVYGYEDGLLNLSVQSLAADRGGNIWIGTEDSGLTILQKGRWNKLDSDRGLRSNNVTGVLQDRKGVIWIGTDKGLDRFLDGKIDPAGGLGGLAGYHVRALLETRDGLLLAGTSQGLFKVSEMKVEKIELTRADSEPEIVSLHEDAERILWIGTKGDGLLRWDKAETMAFTTAEGLTDNYICSLTEDERGNLWMSTNRGVMRISLKQIDDYIKGKTRYLAPTLFEEAEGMAGSQCSGEGQPSVWKNGHGRLYYATAKGIVVFDTASIGVQAVPPLTLIEAVLCDGKPAEIYGVPFFPHRSESFEIHFTALDFRAPEKIRFKYRLEGHDKEFVYLPLNAERVARYRNLAPGEYRFTVNAASNDGIWDENGAFFVFEILPSFFQKPVFYVLVVLALLSAAGSVLLISYQRRQKRRRDKYKTIPIDPKRIEDVIAKLIRLMDEEKLFLDPDLTLNKLSLKLRVHYNHLSRIINERFGLSYNDFVNKYRIEEARKKLTVPEEKGSTILDVAYSTGFYSKSVFNAAFKKFLGMTPTEYRKKHL